MIIFKANLNDISCITNEEEMKRAGFIKKIDVNLTQPGSFIARVTGIDTHFGNDSEFYEIKQYLRNKNIITNLKNLRDYCEEHGSTFYRIDSWNRVFIIDANENDARTFSIYSFRHDLYSLNERKKQNYDYALGID